MVFYLRLQTEIQIQMKQQCKQLLEFCQTLGVLKFVNQRQITNFKLAFNPLQTTQRFYAKLGDYQILWQKLLFRVSKDFKLMEQIFLPLVQKDEMVKRLYDIYVKTHKLKKNNGIVLARCDYYKNLAGQPKLTEYNLFSVGMQSHMEQFQEAKKMTDIDNKDLYADCNTIKKFAETIQQLSAIHKIKGIILFVVVEPESNLFDQMRFQIELIKKGFKVKRAIFSELTSGITKDKEGDLYYKNQLVSFVYYRVGFKQSHFVINGDADIGWKLKEDFQLSNAICIPSVAMELVNQKRIQTELKKPEVLRKYLDQAEATQISKTFVREWEFQSMTNQSYLSLIQEFEANPQRFILKPNLEGGNNNFYGQKALSILKKNTKQESQIYILMEKIHSKSIPNLLMDGFVTQTVDCLYEISRYGVFGWSQGELFKNESAGFLIRAKPEGENQGGIMTGIGAIVPWKFIQE